MCVKPAAGAEIGWKLFEWIVLGRSVARILDLGYPASADSEYAGLWDTI